MSSNGPAHCNCIKNYVLFVYVWLPWVFSAVCGLFLGAVRWGCSVWGAGPDPHGGAGASPFSGFSFGGQSSRLKWLWLMDLVAPRHLLRPVIAPLSPARQGSFLSPGPPGKSMFTVTVRAEMMVSPALERTRLRHRISVIGFNLLTAK